MVIAVSRKKEIEYVFKEDRDRPRDEQTRLYLRPLSKVAQEDFLSGLGGGEDAALRLDLPKVNRVFAEHVMRVENMKDADGETVGLYKENGRLTDESIMAFAVEHRIEAVMHLMEVSGLGKSDSEK